MSRSDLEPQECLTPDIGEGILNKKSRDSFSPEGSIKRRICDIILSAFLLIFLSPFILFTTLAIKFTSKGPVLFVQERLGKNRVPFKLYKFRTMVENAEQKTGPVWAQQNDPRITTIGTFLRKSRLDELPQLFNIIKGDMTLVGCRPIRKHFADLLAKEIELYDVRFIIKPGLTGWAQVNEIYANTIDAQKKKFELDLYYIQNRNLLLDIKILFLTLKVPFKDMGR